MTYSFDIFDTCLIRTCGKPNFVFEILARKAWVDSEETQWFDFALERKRGEAKARSFLARQGREEVTLSEIYSCCDFSRLEGIPSNEVLMKEELEVERLVLAPVVNMRNTINRLRNAGHQIVFISDMYLPYEFIKEVMVNKGFKDSMEILSNPGK